MRLTVVQAGETVLHRPARLLSPEEILSQPIQELIANMRETMYQAPGVGLAAPQVGQPLQIIVIHDKHEYTMGVSKEQLALRERKPIPFHVLINPKLTVIEAAQAEFFEGCLSVAGYLGLVPRALEVSVECLNEYAQPTSLHARGWYARILQHEIDHLNGILYVQRIYPRSLLTQENYFKHWRNKSVDEICCELNLKQT